MAGDKYEKYGRPIPPEDPDANFMSVQETAFLLKCSVTWLRRFLKEHRHLHSYQGRRIVTNREDRAAIYEAKRAGVKPARRSTSRSRRPHKAPPPTAKAIA